MTNHNPANERIKRQYFAYLAEAQGYSEQSIDAVAKAIARFEVYTRYKDFKGFHIEQARAFKRDLSEQRGRSGEPLSKATLYATLTAQKRFFVWLAGPNPRAIQGLVPESGARTCADNLHQLWERQQPPPSRNHPGYGIISN
jgi:site-specific recombinase XerD